eukprot:TRINITY_DN8282_c0_g1_i1.p1 TRINITY_DN8282_c0_g1~~TRINITY_DN8282_c0_g1_i1.p1  ORF type:complete len:909 (+),score=175.63 TRINITY_DN8282_c0_g1_i1:52-2778(+)
MDLALPSPRSSVDCPTPTGEESPNASPRRSRDDAGSPRRSFRGKRGFFGSGSGSAGSNLEDSMAASGSLALPTIPKGKTNALLAPGASPSASFGRRTSHSFQLPKLGAEDSMLSPTRAASFNRLKGPSMESSLNRSPVSSTSNDAQSRAGQMFDLLPVARGAGLMQALVKKHRKKASQTVTVTEEPPPRRTSAEEADRARKELIRQKGARILLSIAQASRFMNTMRGQDSQTGNKAARPLTGASGRKPSQSRKSNKPKDAPDLKAGPAAGSRVALPTAADLHDLPVDLQNTFTCLAMETLRKYLYPRMLLWARRRERTRMREAHNVPRLSIDVLRRQDMFKDWPASLLEEVVSRLVVECYNKEEFIIHEDEQAGSGIYFVMTGAVQVLKKRSRDVKAIGGSNALVLVQLQPIICVGEFSFLTEEPRMASIRAVKRVDCWVLKKNDFSHFVKQLPNSVFQSVIEVAFAARNKNMHLSYPLTEKVLRECPIFRPCPSAMLQELLEGARPYAVPKNLRICRGEQLADRIYFLRNGKCGLMRQLQRRIYERRTSETLISTIKAPTAIGETAVMHGGCYGDTTMTLSTCDFWVLKKSVFDVVLRRHRGVESLMMAEARNQRQEQLAHQQNLFRECIFDIPLLREAATRQMLRTLVHRFNAHVYKPLSVVCSTTRFADRVVILYKGRIRVGPRSAESTWHKGECAGFTCVVPHRWRLAAVACDIVECLELPLPAYVQYLKLQKIYKQVVRWVKQLLFPAAFSAEVAEAAEELVAHLRTPVMYPRSTSTRVNLHEEGFSDTHYTHLEYLHTLDAPASPTGSPRGLPAHRSSASHMLLTPLAQHDMLESGRAKRLPTSWVRLSNFLWKKPFSAITTADKQGLVMAIRRTGRRRRRKSEKTIDDGSICPQTDWRSLI